MATGSIEIYNTFRGSMATIMLALRDWWYESHYSWSKLDCFWARMGDCGCTTICLTSCSLLRSLV